MKWNSHSFCKVPPFNVLHHIPNHKLLIPVDIKYHCLKDIKAFTQTTTKRRSSMKWNPIEDWIKHAATRLACLNHGVYTQILLKDLDYFHTASSKKPAQNLLYIMLHLCSFDHMTSMKIQSLTLLIILPSILCLPISTLFHLWDIM